jgi:hypothetical protein
MVLNQGVVAPFHERIDLDVGRHVNSGTATGKFQLTDLVPASFTPQPSPPAAGDAK